MANQPGLLKATAPTATAAGGDTSLPDATRLAKLVLLALLLLAFGLAILANASHWTARPFTPSKDQTANFALFAGFYVAAQVIERLMELVAPLLPWFWWTLPATLKLNDPNDPGSGSLPPEAVKSVTAAQLKADRGAVALGVTTLLGVAASFLFGLFFLQAVGMPGSNTIDTFVTGVTIAAGTKPLHDLISSIQNQNSPATGTTV